MKFGLPIQTEMPMTTVRSKLKMQVELQHGGDVKDKKQIFAVLYVPLNGVSCRLLKNNSFFYIF